MRGRVFVVLQIVGEVNDSVAMLSLGCCLIFALAPTTMERPVKRF